MIRMVFKVDFFLFQLFFNNSYYIFRLAGTYDKSEGLL